MNKFIEGIVETVQLVAVITAACVSGGLWLMLITAPYTLQDQDAGAIPFFMFLAGVGLAWVGKKVVDKVNYGG